LHTVDETDGSVSTTGTAVSSSGNLALSPSDVASQLFGSTGAALVRIAVADGQQTTVAPLTGIVVSCVVDDMFSFHCCVCETIGVGVQSRRWLHLYDVECQPVCALLDRRRARRGGIATARRRGAGSDLHRQRPVPRRRWQFALPIRPRHQRLDGVDELTLAIVRQLWSCVVRRRALCGHEQFRSIVFDRFVGLHDYWAWFSQLVEWRWPVVIV
jgi:hypothetical protein